MKISQKCLAMFQYPDEFGDYQTVKLIEVDRIHLGGSSYMITVYYHWDWHVLWRNPAVPTMFVCDSETLKYVTAIESRPITHVERESIKTFSHPVLMTHVITFLCEAIPHIS